MPVPLSGTGKLALTKVAVADHREKAGDPVRVFTFQGHSHVDGINPTVSDWETVRSLLHKP